MSPPLCFTALNEAVALYRDDFLTGFSLSDSPNFDEWQQAQTESLRQGLVTALRRLIQLYRNRGDPDSALPLAHRRLNLNPLDEAAHRQLMQLYVLTGQRTAALGQYRRCVQILKKDLGVQPSTETTLLYHQIRSDTFIETTDPQRFEEDSPTQGTISTFMLYQDWGEMPTIDVIYGRQAEQTELTRWLIADRSRLVVILGLGGIGKTTLAAKVVASITNRPDHGHFDFIMWRSLLNAPPLTEILRDWLSALSDQRLIDLPTGLDEQFRLLLAQLRRRRSLLVLDNVESIMQEGEQTGFYRTGYEAYGRLFQRLGESQHQSCLLLTSREKPREFVRLEGPKRPVRTLTLSGVTAEAGLEILQEREISAPAEQAAALIERFSGNPLALRLVAETIQMLFAGDMAAFLAENVFIFGGIRDVLEQQFSRLSALEQELVIWLAIERETVSTQTLGQNLIRPGPRANFIEALRSLARRSLLEQRPLSDTEGSGFTLQNVVMKYVTDYLVDQICDEIMNGRLDLFRRHALLKAQSKAYIRHSQARVILQPIAVRLLNNLDQSELAATLSRRLNDLRTDTTQPVGYAAGNILNLLDHLGVDLQGYDFSNLPIWQAFLAGNPVTRVNFAGADLNGSIFTDTFRAIMALTFSQDGRLLAAGTLDNEVRLWRTSVGQLHHILTGHTNFVWSVAFSPDDRWLASASADRTIRVWDVNMGQTVVILQGHTHWVRSVVFHPIAPLLASASEDRTIRLWDTRTWEVRAILQGPPGQNHRAGL